MKLEDCNKILAPDSPFIWLKKVYFLKISCSCLIIFTDTKFKKHAIFLNILNCVVEIKKNAKLSPSER